MAAMDTESNLMDSVSEEAVFERLAEEADTCLQQGDIPKVIEVLTAAALRFPSHDGIFNNLAASQLEAGGVLGSRENLLRAIELNPDPIYLSNLLRTILFDIESSNSASLVIAKSYGKLVANVCETPPSGSTGGSGSIRVGYMSDGFRNHPCFRNLSSVIKHHSAGFEVFCYPTSTHPDSGTERLRALGGRWRDLSFLSDDEAARRIREDGIDVLVETSGHHGPNRLPILARRPAEVLVSLNSFPATLGIENVTCRITDAVIDPPGAEQYYVEKNLVRLSRPVQCYIPPSRRTSVNLLPGRAKGAVTLAAFHRLAKISPVTVSCWARILSRLPGAQILLHHSFGGTTKPSNAFRAPLEGQFRQLGIGPERLRWVGQLSTEETMRLYNECDITLDPYPFNGAATTLESLWMGVPVLTLTGERPVSRYSASFLAALGLTDWITRSPDEYVEKAVAAAGDFTSLARLRKSLRPKMRKSVLMDGEGFVRELEGVYLALLGRGPNGSSA